MSNSDIMSNADDSGVTAWIKVCLNKYYSSHTLQTYIHAVTPESAGVSKSGHTTIIRFQGLGRGGWTNMHHKTQSTQFLASLFS